MATTVRKDKTTLMGFDMGMGAIKLSGEHGGLQLQSQVAINGTQRVSNMVGLATQVAPLHIRMDHGSFYVGPDAHDWGRAVENLDYDRLTGAPEMHALLYGSLTRYIQQHGPFTSPLSLVVGMPLEPLTGPEAQDNIKAVRKWMTDKHQWQADGKDYEVKIAEVKVTSQPVGALFDYLLDDQGKFIQSRKAAFKAEVGIISVGFNTIELLVVRDRKPVQKFTAGTTAGVRHLLELVNANRMYTLGEMDNMLRSGSLDIKEALPIWEREVTGVINDHWGTSWKRFQTILLVGGGAALLRKTLPFKFNGKAFVPDNPVLSISRGLRKLRVQAENRKRK
jgi:hypothetical protein